jgi:Bifunctional DNA primase/polymerase, N-terminal
MNALNEAIKLARRVPIFPCDNDKTPFVAHGFKDASSDPNLIRKWWEKYPDALIGVPTGPKFVVIDLDLQHDEARRWLSDNGGRLPITRTHRTRSGGQHLLFAPHPEVKCTSSKLHPNVDTRGDGGYIVWWPSEGYEVSHHSTLADVPDWIINSLRPQPAPVVHLATARPMPLRKAERQLDGIYRTVAGAAVGQRNAIVHWGACRLWELIEAGDLSEGAARHFIQSAASRNGLSPGEIDRTFDSARRSVRGAA